MQKPNVRHQMWFNINVWWGLYNNRLTNLVFYKCTLTVSRCLEYLQDIINDLMITCHSLSSPVFMKLCLLEEFREQIRGMVVWKSGLKISLIWHKWAFTCEDTSNSTSIRPLR